MAEKKRKSPPGFRARQKFTSRLLAKAPIAESGNTNYEEIGCVGYQPEFKRLEAVVYIKQPTGFGGPLCSAGSTEYVRFFVSWDGGPWEDQGVTSFAAYDIPEAAEHRLEYAATLEIEPKRKLCFRSNLVRARAILSWNLEPPAGDESFTPPWGDVHDTVIQIDPLKLIPLHELVAEAKLELPDEIAQAVDLGKEVQLAEPKALSVAQLKHQYAKLKVEPHRFAFAEAQKLVKDPEFAASLSAGVVGPIGEMEIDWSGILDALEGPDGNTSYEELECVGLNPNTSELVATFRIKKPYGYSGGPCTKGSKEYVTFWGDFNNNGIYETCLGTAQVTVYDFAKVPKGGIEYAVFLPVDLNPYRQPCQDGPRLAGIRAILSWNKPHPCHEWNEAPYWGNSEDTVIQIPPGPKYPDPEDLYKPYLYTVCWRNVCSIDQATGLSTGDRPFGGNIWITGEFPVGPAITVPNRFKYRVKVRPLPGGVWQTLDNQFSIWVTQGAGTGPASTYKITQQVDADGYYTYREYGTPVTGSWRRVSGPNRALALWRSGGETGKWEIMLEGKDTWTNQTYTSGVQICPDGSSRQNVVVKLDQERPYAELSITGYTRGKDTHTAVDCDTFKVGDIIHGDYKVTDEHFGNLWLRLLPTKPANGVKVDPGQRTYYAPDFVDTLGESGTWKIDTGKHQITVGGKKVTVGPMDPCGYVVLLETRDRTIAHCGAGWYNRLSVGFCLEK